jgi:hypothetical protein
MQADLALDVQAVTELGVIVHLCGGNKVERRDSSTME